MPDLLDPEGRPIPREAIARLREEAAGPTLAGVRPPFAPSPAEGLTPAHLASIHRQAAYGHSLYYLQLAEDIEERDLHYLAVLGTRKRQVSQLPVTVEAASDAPEHAEHAQFLRDWLAEGVLDAALFDMADAIGKGFSVLEIMWDTTPGAVLPRALVYRPQRWFDVSLADGDSIMLREATGLQPLAEHKFIVHRHPAKSGLVMRSGLARIASWAWMFKAFTLKDWAIFVQNYGQPVRLGKYGPESTPEDRAVLLRAVRNIAGDCAAIIPRSMEIEFVEAKNLADGSELYERRADWMDRQVSKAVLGQTATTDAAPGSHAIGGTHRQVQEDIERHDARLLSATLNRQLVRQIVALNFGPQRKYPRLRIGRPDEVPLNDWISALDKMIPRGLKVQAKEVRNRLGLSEVPPEEADVLGAAPAAPAPPPGNDPAATPALGQAPEASDRPGEGDPSRTGPAARLKALHAQRPPEPDYVAAMTERLARDAAGAMAGLTDQVRAELEAATDMQDLAARLAALRLDPAELAAAMARGLALAHLVGQAALLDELRGR